MLGTAKLVAFVATADPVKAKTFYGEVLELEKLEDSPFALVFDANGTIVRVQKVESVSPPPYTVLGWEVTDIATTVEGLIAKGVEFEHYDGLPQDELGIWATPDNAKVAWFKDPDRNTLSLTQLP